MSIASPADAERLGIHVIHQDRHLAGRLTVAEQLYLGRSEGRHGWVSRRELNRRAAADLERTVGLRGAPGLLVDQLTVAEQQLSGLERRASSAVARATTGTAPVDRAQALAEALTAEGYAATASAISSGGQLCQHHCPVAHVAAEFPQLCEAETAVISRLVGTHVQRLATIAHGDGICTTHIPAARPPGNRTTPASPVPNEQYVPTKHRERTSA